MIGEQRTAGQTGGGWPVERVRRSSWARQCSRWRSPRRRRRRRSRCRTPNIEPFADCPVYVKHVAHCVVATTTSGEFKLANKTVPITKPIVLQGGIIEGSHVLVPAANGNTLSRTPLTVPGGLTGIEGLPLGGEVIAVTELAGPVELFEENLSDGRDPP